MRLSLLLLTLAPLLGCGSDVSIGKVTVDRDSDGYDETVDCDDAQSAVNPSAPELCDGLDNDCDGVVDDEPEDATTFYADADYDGHGDPAAPIIACDAPVDTSLSADDCDDTQAEVFPGNDELCDGLDNDCDGDTDEDAEDVIAVYLDDDGDGYGDDSTEEVACAPGPGEVTQGGDCDDDDARFYPGADESDCADPNDYNCDGSSGYNDNDADGVPACEDCDDSNAAANPSATEVCDALNVDEDCDGQADDLDSAASGKSKVYEDGDGDAYGDSTTSLTVCDAPSGYVADSTDCDDTKASVNPGATEVCDASNTDEDCDGKADDLDSAASGKTTGYTDDDGDTYGDPSTGTTACDLPAGSVYTNTDCDDTDAAINPAASEVCDSANTDEDCDGKTDDSDSSATGKTSWYRDADSDAYGSSSSTTSACDQPSGYVSLSTDCDDTKSSINPGATEVCDSSNTDEDCDGNADDSDSSVSASGKSTYYRDADSDTYGSSTSTSSACDLPTGYVTNSTDCDDTKSSINPGATEVCDASNTDEDCDGKADDADSSVSASGKSTYYRDADSDTYGSSTSTSSACDLPSGYVTTSTDCDDTKSGVNPGATEVCDASNTDEDCDGKADDSDSSVSASGKSTYYRDADSDTYGSSTSTSSACDLPSGYVTSSTDCDDTKSSINPAATEVCDASNTDEDCDGKADDNDSSVSASGKTTYYRDADSDTYGSSTSTSSACDLPSGYVTTSTDCDDTKASVNPAATEVCDASNTDEDCDGKTDDNDSSVSASGKSTWYRDADSDTYGSSSTTSAACDKPTGYVSLSTDCDDTKSSINPGATEVCDTSNTDEDCDGKADDADSSVSASGKTTYYRDADSDTYGSATSTTSVCDLPSGYVTNDDDCNDASASVSPADAEVCDDGVDNDCDGSDKVCPGPGYSGVYDVNSGYDVKIYGNRASDKIGSALIGGDFDGDGLGDMIVGGPGAAGTSSFTGRLFGFYGPFTAGAQEPTTNDDFGHYSSATAASGHFGDHAANVGDLNGDGRDDYAAHRDGTNLNAYIYAGGTTSMSAYTSGVLSSPTCNTFAPGGQFYTSGGTNELVCGNAASSSYTGVVMVYEGTSTTASATFTGEALYDSAGYDLDGGGDIDGDGLDDLLIGAPENSAGGASAGAAYVVYAEVTGTVSLSAADVKIIGDTSGDNLSYVVNLVGDADSDGRDDLLMAAPFNDVGGADAGAVYLVTQPTSGRAAAVAEAMIVGGAAGDALTDTAMDMGDVDGDGTLDLLVSSYQHDNGSATDAGAVHLIYGPVSGSYDLATDADATWTSLYSSDFVGITFSVIPDSDGDGDVELAFGTWAHDYGTTSTSASSRGAVWIWPGM